MKQDTRKVYKGTDNMLELKIMNTELIKNI